MKIIAKYIGDEGPPQIACDATKVEAFRRLRSLFADTSSASPAVFDEIEAAVKPVVVSLWSKYGARMMPFSGVPVSSPTAVDEDSLPDT